MCKKLSRIWSMLLVLVMLVQLLPAQALAASPGSAAPAASTPASGGEVLILEELTDKRTEFSKEYLLSNGLHMASVYSNAVHYEDNGQWKDIDNTLLAVGTGSQAAYTNTAGLWDVRFPQELSAESGITVTKDGHSLTFYMSGQLRAPVLEEISPITAGDTEFTLTAAEPAQAQLVELNSAEAKAEAEHPETVLDKLRSRLQYPDVCEDTSIVYDLTSNQLKESVILESYDEGLRGFQFTLDTGDLIPVLTDSSQILLMSKDSKEPVMVMPAPYLLDSADGYSSDVGVELVKKGDQYILLYTLPRSWLAAQERQWPVILDPVVSGQVTFENVEDRCVYSEGYAEPTFSLLQCGYGGPGLGIMRFYMRFVNLPEIASSNVIVNATVQLNKLYDYGNTSPVEVHRAVTPWSEETLTWTENDDEHFDSKVEDFAVCKEVDFYRWDITDLVRSWYEGDNYGMVFKCPQSVEKSTTQNMQRFTSTDFLTHNIGEKPMLNITFRNNNGLESYWDYTSASAGRAGTGYINNYSGNLVWVRGDMGYGGCLMPVSISHVYNSNDSTKDSFGMGYGWRTNYNQRVYLWGNENAVTTYYVWEDGDGTAHYFYPDAEHENTYLDEDGLELTLTLEDSGYILTDKLGNTSYFDDAGRLVELKNNQQDPSSILIAYDSEGRISTITDSAERDYVFTYNDDGLLRKIDYLGLGSEPIDTVQFGYNTDGQLISVTDPDGKASTYGYRGTANSTLPNLLVSAEDIDGYCLTYAYTAATAGQPARVASVLETDGNTQGGSLAITYQKNQTTLTDHNGNVQILQFNNLGNTLSIQDDQGWAQYAGYAVNDSAEAGKANQLTLSSKLQNTVVNLLPQGSFENTQPWQSLSGATLSHHTGVAQLGSKSLKIVSAGDGTSGAESPSIPVEAGESYTFSAWVKTTGPDVCLTLRDGSTTVTGQTLSFDPIDDGWSRLQVHYTAPTSGNVTAQVLTEGAGTVYIDCVQLENAPTASRYNLVENGDFRSTNGWSSSEGITTANSTAAPELSSQVYQLTGNCNAATRIFQDIIVSGNAGDCFVLGGWAKGDSVPLGELYGVNRRFGIIATFYNGDAQVGESTIATFNPYVPGYLNLNHEDISQENETRWQNASAPLVAKGAYTKITLELAYDYNCNEAIFDGIQLFREEFGSSYAYDNDGNVQSVTDIQGGITRYEYENNDLTAAILPNGGRLTYEYDDHHNVTKATSETGVVYEFEYDAEGRNTAVSVVADGKTITASSAEEIDEDNLTRTVTTTDAAGNETVQIYDLNTNELKSVVYPDQSETEYTYDAMYRVATAQAQLDENTTLSVGYTYENDLLKTIVTPSTTYTFNHGNFGLRTGIQVGSQTLASYEYTNDRNFYLQKLAYGNGDVVEYTYDNQGRVTSQVYENGDTVTYRYDNTGALATMTDSATGRTTTYYYDLTDRLMQYVETGDGYSHSVGYLYDTVNNLTSQVETVNGEEFTTSYTYNSDNTVSSVSNGDTTQVILYDTFGRIDEKEILHNGDTLMSVVYGYRGIDADSTTSQVEELEISAPGLERTYTYSYDDKGNILSVSDGSHTTSYAYDKAGQLLRENNQAAGKTWVWEYDRSGNIETRTEYAYTTGSLGQVLDTVQYQYNNDNWGDLLTSYDGQTITYDQIGNPLNDGTWEYTWEHGRRLSSMTDGTVTLNYEYNADGIRTKKTVITASDHSHIFQTRVVAPTCTENGYTLHECSCGYSYQSTPVASTGHTFVASQVEATCTAHGYTLQECECGYGYQEGTSGHTFTDTVVAPTAEENGYTLHECACGYSYQDTPVAALGITNSSASGNATNTKVYDYVYNGSSLSYLTVTTTQFGQEPTADTLYFGNGTVTYNDVVYYYVTNLQGDVVAILDANGNPKVQYTYDAWGKILSISGPMADTLGAVNPLTYRGYVYDAETDLYYLESRYYDPAVERFINADSLVSTGQGFLGNNMFAYCNNNPVCAADPHGTLFFEVLLGLSALYFLSNYLEDAIWKGCAEILREYDYNLSADLLTLCASGPGHSYAASPDSDISQKIASDSGFTNDVMQRYQGVHEKQLEQPSYEFPLSHGDLGAALHRVDYSYTLCSDNTRDQYLLVTITDTFDFTEFKNPFAQDSFKEGILWLANDIALVDMGYGFLDPVPVTIEVIIPIEP